MVTPNDGVENGSSVISSPLTIANSEPTGITASVTSSDMFYNNSTLTCAATASDIDPEDAVLTYTYAWSTGDTGADLVLSGSMMPGAEVTCTATATDGSGAAISVDATETLVNRAPTVDSVTLPQDVTAETASILCDATGSDLDGETPTLTYAWTINGQANAETSNTLTDSFAYQDVIVCTVTSADATGTGSSMDATTTVLNTAPVVDSVALTPATVYTNDTITATSVLSDVDAAQAGSLTANYEWFVSGASVQNGASNTLDASLFDKDDQVYVVVTANDGVDNSAPVTSSSVTIMNSAPTNAQVSVTSSNAFYNDSTLTCSITADDLDVVDGTDTLTYTYAWSTGDTGADLVLSGSLIPTTNITCTATATDSSGASVSGTATETLGNRAPTVDSISLPASATAATTSLLCSATASDLDGTTPSLSYVWTIDGNPLTETSDTLTGPFVYGEVIGCTAFADDGMSTGTASTSVSISNTTPTVDSIALTPATVYTNDTITATVLVSDIDTVQVGSLTANYEWFVDGASVQNGASNTLDGVLMFNRDQDVYVVVTANDGLEDGTPVQSNTVTVLNTVPTAPTVSISANNNPAEVGVDDLTCTIDVASTDVDGDAVTYDYTWYMADGVTVASTTLGTTDLSDVYLGTGTDVGTWTCEVVANDGDADSAIANAVYDVDNYCQSNSISLNPLPTESTTWGGGGYGTQGWNSSGYYHHNSDHNKTLIPNLVQNDELVFEIEITRFQDQVSVMLNLLEVTSGPTALAEVPIWIVFGVDSSTLLTHSQHSSATFANKFQVFYAPNTATTFSDVTLIASGDLNSSLSDWSSIEVRYINASDVLEIKQDGELLTSVTTPTDLSLTSIIMNTTALGRSANVGWRNLSTICPEEDLDGDGVAAWEDCDDGDSLAWDAGSGASSACAATSCKAILDDGHAQLGDDGNYWIDPDGTSSFEVYCDMTTDGGGWTLCGSMNGGEGGLARYGFDEYGIPSINGAYSRDCTNELLTIGTEVLATNDTLAEYQIWSVIQSSIKGLTNTTSNPSIEHIFDSRAQYSGFMNHGYCDVGNCVSYTNGYTVGTSIESMINGNFVTFGLGSHCDGSCNEAAVWYNQIVSHRINFFTR